MDGPARGPRGQPCRLRLLADTWSNSHGTERPALPRLDGLAAGWPTCSGPSIWMAGETDGKERAGGRSSATTVGPCGRRGKRALAGGSWKRGGEWGGGGCTPFGRAAALDGSSWAPAGRARSVAGWVGAGPCGPACLAAGSGWWPRWQRAPQTHPPVTAAVAAVGAAVGGALGVRLPPPARCCSRRPVPHARVLPSAWDHPPPTRVWRSGVFAVPVSAFNTSGRGTRDPLPLCRDPDPHRTPVLRLGSTVSCTSTCFSFSPLLLSPPFSIFPPVSFPPLPSPSSPPSDSTPSSVCSILSFEPDSGPVAAALPRPDHARCPPGNTAVLYCAPAERPRAAPPPAAGAVGQSSRQLGGGRDAARL